MSGRCENGARYIEARVSRGEREYREASAARVARAPLARYVGLPLRVLSSASCVVGEVWPDYVVTYDGTYSRLPGSGEQTYQKAVRGDSAVEFPWAWPNNETPSTFSLTRTLR
eukprot:scaffold23917_cov59-Phaeocystis_antarctica.AAC.3